MKPVSVGQKPVSSMRTDVKADKVKTDAQAPQEAEGGKQEAVGKGKGKGQAKRAEKMEARIAKFEAKLQRMAEKGHTPAGLSQALERFRANAERFNSTHGAEGAKPAPEKTDLGVG
jgi:archaellum component FlaC